MYTLQLYGHRLERFNLDERGADQDVAVASSRSNMMKTRSNCLSEGDVAAAGTKKALYVRKKILFPCGQLRVTTPIPYQVRECEIGVSLFRNLATNVGHVTSPCRLPEIGCQKRYQPPD